MLVPTPKQGPRAVITDFGLAGSIAAGGSSSQESRRFCGTLAYAAPERLAGHRATPASDVYALGLMTLEMLTGGGIKRRVGSPGDLDTATRSLPPEWDRLITRMTHPVPRMRLSDAESVAAALRRMRVSRSRNQMGWRRPVAWFAIAVCAVAIVGSLVDDRRRIDAKSKRSQTGSSVPGRDQPRSSKAVVAVEVLAPRKPATVVSPSLSPPGKPSRPRIPLDRSIRTSRPRSVPVEDRSHVSSSAPAAPDDIVRELPRDPVAPTSPPAAALELIDPFGGGVANHRRAHP